MKRWTIKELKEMDDRTFVCLIMQERKETLTNPYSPLSQKIDEMIEKVRKYGVK